MDVKLKVNADIVAANDPVTGNEASIEHSTQGELHSYTSPLIERWQQEDLFSDLDIPDELKKAIESSLEQIWMTANKLASVETAKLEQQVLDLNQEVKELKEKNRAIQAGLVDILRDIYAKK